MRSHCAYNMRAFIRQTDEVPCRHACTLQGELFEMTYVGSVDASSGFTSIVPASAVEKLQGSHASHRSWDKLKRLLSSHDVEWPHEDYPFLFVGHIIEADTASVFQRQTGKDVDGLQITSNA